MKTILHIISGLGDGGAEAVLLRLCNTERGAAHHVISLTDEGKYGALLRAEGVTVTAIGMPRRKVTLRGLWRMWRLIRRLKPDVVQTWMYHADLLGGVVARLAGRRRVFWGIHHTTLDPKESPRSTIAVAQLCAGLSRIVPRGIICCASEAQKVHAGLGYDARRMTVIANGYDLSVFRPDPAAGAAVRTELGIAPDQPLIGFVARFDPQKDHATLLHAMALLHQKGRAPLCLLIGNGLDADNAALVAQIRVLGLGDHIRLLGRRSDIPAVMNALDLHVMSSAFGEAFPNVLAEAMACGTPVVSTRVGDAPLIVGDTGHIVPPRDPQALADAVASMLAEMRGPGAAERRKAASDHIAAHFTIAMMAEKYRAVWQG